MNSVAGTFSKCDALLAAARSGDRAALGQLTERFRPYLLMVARRMFGDARTGKPESVVQDGLLVAVQSLDHFRGTTAREFLAWLTGIVRNKALAKMRRRIPSQPLPAGSSDGELLATGSSTPSDHAARRERAVLLRAAVDRLPPDYRELIDLRSFQGCSYAEIANRMGKSELAVRQLWVRSLQKLRDLLGEESGF
jgi:RNA polymerase sigma-70 factor (ECF subfamily)